MRRNASFWRNAAIVGLLHLAVVVGLVKWSAHQKRQPLTTSVLWLDGTATLPDAVSSAVAATLPEPAEATPEPTVASESVPEEKAEPSPAKTELPLPTPSATPTAQPSATAKPTPQKKRPPKESPTPRPKKKTRKREKVSSKPTPEKKRRDEKASKPVAAKKTGTAKVSAASGGSRGGGAGDKKFAWYGDMLHDRFFSAWDQPTSVVVTGAKMSVLVRLRVESDGRVSKFELVRPSGNVVVDDSVAAVAKRVTRVDPLPAGLDGPYDVQISFELSPQ